MATLRNSNVSPIGQDELLADMVKLKEQGSQIDKSVLEKSFEVWDNFRKSPTGQKDKAEMELRKLNELLGQSLGDMLVSSGLPVEVLQEKRAEWRGQRRVWLLILNEPERLKVQLEQLEDLEEPEKRNALRWNPLPKKFKKSEKKA